jgi:hypothetical protein
MPPREEDGNDFSKSRIGPCNTNELSTYEYWRKNSWGI